MKMLLLTETCWVNPDAVIAVEHAFNLAVDEMVSIHLDTGATLTIPGTTVANVVQRIEGFYRQQQSEFAETLQGDVRPIR